MEHNLANYSPEAGDFESFLYSSTSTLSTLRHIFFCMLLSAAFDHFLGMNFKQTEFRVRRSESSHVCSKSSPTKVCLFSAVTARLQATATLALVCKELLEWTQAAISACSFTLVLLLCKLNICNWIYPLNFIFHKWTLNAFYCANILLWKPSLPCISSVWWANCGHWFPVSQRSLSKHKLNSKPFFSRFYKASLLADAL